MTDNKKSKKWTDEEINILINFYPKGAAEEVQKYLPNRTLSSIHHKASRLKIGYENDNWTKDEIDIITEKYPVGGKDLVHTILPHRSISAIRTKASDLGLSYDAYHEEKDWTEQEIETLKYWFPLLGIVSVYETRSIIGTPSIFEKLPNRSRSSLRNKVHRLNLTYDPQMGVTKGKYRCVLCLEIKSEIDYNSNKLKAKTYVCKNCEITISKSKYKSDPYRVLINNTIMMVKQRAGKKIKYNEGKIIIDKILERPESTLPNGNFRCYYEDEYCKYRGVVGIELGHIVPHSKGGYPQDPNNLFFVCHMHNRLMSDLKRNEFIDSMRSLYKTLNNHFIKH